MQSPSSRSLDDCLACHLLLQPSISLSTLCTHSTNSLPFPNVAFVTPFSHDRHPTDSWCLLCNQFLGYKSNTSLGISAPDPNDPFFQKFRTRTFLLPPDVYRIPPHFYIQNILCNCCNLCNLSRRSTLSALFRLQSRFEPCPRGIKRSRRKQCAQHTPPWSQLPPFLATRGGGTHPYMPLKRYSVSIILAQRPAHDLIDTITLVCYISLFFGLLPAFFLTLFFYCTSKVQPGKQSQLLSSLY